MINEVMDYCRNHFVKNKYDFYHGIEYGNFVFDSTTKTITGTFDTDDFTAGGYVYISGSRVNDTAYLITDVTDTVLTLSTEPTDEDNTDKYTIIIYASYPPKSFTSLADDITSWVASNGSSNQGIKSVSIDDFSQTFGDSMSNGGGWQGAFKGRLSQFKKVYSDIKEVF